MVKKLTTEEWVEKARGVHGERYDYSKTEYRNAKTSVKIICHVHGVFLQVPHSHLAGCGCPTCGVESRATSSRLTLEEFLARAREKHGEIYDYSEVQFSNVDSSINIRCQQHGVFTQRVMSHLRGNGCPSCGHEQTAQKKLKGLQGFIRDAREAHGDTYTYPEQAYLGSRSSVRIICPSHGEFKQWADNHLKGVGCPECSNIYRSIQQQTNLEDFCNRARAIHGDKYDYSEVSPNGWESKIQIGCYNHGVFTQSLGAHLMGQGCPKCACSPQSKWETEIKGYLESLGFIVESNQRVLRGKELDLYIPDKGVGIELHGLYWHSEEKRGRLYHKQKHDLAEGLGIRLIQIFEDEWVLRRSAVEHSLALLLGTYPPIGARKLMGKRVEYSAVKYLYEGYHLQGTTMSASHHYGLYLEGELVAAASFGKSRFHSSETELIRYVTKRPVLGGLSKLISLFRKDFPGNQLVSYSDIRWFSGAAYERAGFVLDRVTPPGYYWCKKLLRLSRLKFQKHRIKTIIPDADLAKSEREIAEAAGFWRVFDCGQKRWVLK